MRFGKPDEMPEGPRDFIIRALNIALALACQPQDLRNITSHRRFFSYYDSGQSIHRKKKCLPLLVNRLVRSSSNDIYRDKDIFFFGAPH